MAALGVGALTGPARGPNFRDGRGDVPTVNTCRGDQLPVQRTCKLILPKLIINNGCMMSDAIHDSYKCINEIQH